MASRIAYIPHVTEECHILWNGRFHFLTHAANCGTFFFIRETPAKDIHPIVTQIKRVKGKDFLASLGRIATRTSYQKKKQKTIYSIISLHPYTGI